MVGDMKWTRNGVTVTFKDIKRYDNCCEFACQVDSCEHQKKCLEIVRFLNWRFERGVYGLSSDELEEHIIRRGKAKWMKH